jgi:hypothetical protein
LPDTSIELPLAQNPHGRLCLLVRYYAFRIISAAFSPIMIDGAFVFPPTRVGMIDASTTRRPPTP